MKKNKQKQIVTIKLRQLHVIIENRPHSQKNRFQSQ